MYIFFGSCCSTVHIVSDNCNEQSSRSIPFFLFPPPILISKSRDPPPCRGPLSAGSLRLEPGLQVCESARISRKCLISLRTFCPRFHRNSRNRTTAVQISDKAGAVFLSLARSSLQLVARRGQSVAVHHDGNTTLNNWRLERKRPNLRTNQCTRRSTTGPGGFDRFRSLKQKDIHLWGPGNLLSNYHWLSR